MRERDEREAREEGYKYTCYASLQDPNRPGKGSKIVWSEMIGSGLLHQNELDIDDLTRRMQDAQQEWDLGVSKSKSG